jgi:hypothetical protein
MSTYLIEWRTESGQYRNATVLAATAAAALAQWESETGLSAAIIRNLQRLG